MRYNKFLNAFQQELLFFFLLNLLPILKNTHIFCSWIFFSVVSSSKCNENESITFPSDQNLKEKKNRIRLLWKRNQLDVKIHLLHSYQSNNDDVKCLICMIVKLCLFFSYFHLAKCTNLFYSSNIHLCK